MISTALVISSILLGAEEAIPPGVAVGPAEEDLAFAILSIKLPASPEAGRFEILDSSTRSPVPSQVIEENGERRLLWMVGRMPKGGSSRFEIKVSKEKAPGAGADRIGVKRADARIAVAVDGKPFTTLVADPKEHKPYLYPILVDGTQITRHYPMEKFPGEDTDHVHQRSFWFTHGAVNDVDFWSESNQAGKVIQRKVVKAEGGAVAGTIVTEDEWVDRDGKSVLGDEQSYRFYDLGAAGRMIDFSIVLTARYGAVEFGDTKEGTFGIRLAESMKEARGGRIENSRGQVTEKEAWGKPAEWVDCSGPIDGKTFGVAILDHPSSFRHPTTWHVRGYGLFAANPFGLKEFTADKSKDGKYRLEKGMSLLFRYRVFFHPGAAKDARVAEAWNGFAHPPKVSLLSPSGGKE